MSEPTWKATNRAHWDEKVALHLGHLHHTLAPTHLAELGTIDVVMVPVDGTFTLNQEEMIEVLQQIGPKLVIPMHIFSQASLEKFLRLAGGFYAVHWETGSTVVLSKPELPAMPAILVAGRPVGPRSRSSGCERADMEGDQPRPLG